jgi:eukaryotic-like serine/threonine-protein kinase
MAKSKVQDRFGLVGAHLDNYEIERVVAAGGFGIVYFARHRVIRQEAAIKVLKLPDDLGDEERETFMQKFLEEAQTIAALKHPAIVTVLDFKVTALPIGGKTPWMALEWIEGETLAQHLLARRGQGGRDPRTCLSLLEPVFDALALAHARGVAHRDVKPANIMLPSRADSGRFGVTARLLDFGIAKVVGPEENPGTDHTETTSPFQAYSLPYAASEQVSGMRSGPRTDVHALALVLVEMLTDCAPFATGDRGALMMQVMSPTRPTPARFGVQVGAWEMVLAKALSLVPSERYANAGEFLAALERHIPAEVTRTEPLSAPPPPPVTTSPETLSFASITVPFPTETAPTPTPKRFPRGLVAVGVVAVAACVALAGSMLRTSPAAPVARVAVAPPVARAESTHPVDASTPVVAAPAVAAPAVAAPVVAAPAVAAPDETPDDATERPRARRHHRHLRVTLQ